MGMAHVYINAMINDKITGDQTRKFNELRNALVKELGGEEYNKNAQTYNAILRILMKDPNATLDNVKEFKEQVDFMANEKGITNTSELLTSFDQLLRSNSEYANSKVTAEELLEMFTNYSTGTFPSTCTSFEDYVTKCLKGELTEAPPIDEGGDEGGKVGEGEPLPELGKINFDASFLLNGIIKVQNELKNEGFTSSQINDYFEYDKETQTYKLKDGIVDDNGKPITDKQQLKDFLGTDSFKALKDEGFHEDVIKQFFDKVSDGSKTEFKLSAPYTSYEITSNEAGADVITLYTEDHYKLVVTVDLKGNMTVEKKLHFPEGNMSIQDVINMNIEKTQKTFSGDAGSVTESSGEKYERSDIEEQNYAKDQFAREYGVSADECIEAGLVELVKNEETGEYTVELKEGACREDGKMITTMEELAKYLGADELQEMRDKGISNTIIEVLFERVMDSEGNYTYKPIGDDYTSYRIVEGKNPGDKPTIELLNDKGYAVKTVFINEGGSFSIRKPDASKVMYNTATGETKELGQVFNHKGEVGAMTEAEARAEYNLDDATFDKFFEVVEENGVYYVDPKSPYTLDDVRVNYQFVEGEGAKPVKTYILTAYNGSGSVRISEDVYGEPKITYLDSNGKAIDEDGTINPKAIDCSDIPGYRDNTQLHERGKGWQGSLDKMKEVATDVLNNQSLRAQLEAQFRAACAKAGVKYDSAAFDSMYQQSINATLGADGVITGRGARGLSSKGHAYCNTQTLVDTFLTKFDGFLKTMLDSQKTK